MLSKLIKDDIKKKEGGFTIVEVMIVLAIAGLVLAIVFVAVPALRRTSNNAGRSADVGQLATAISSYSGSRNGKLPATLGEATHVAGSELGWSYYEFTPAPTAVSANPAAPVTAAADIHLLSYISNASGEAIASGDIIKHGLPSPDEVHVWVGYKCVNDNFSTGNPEAKTASASPYVAADFVKGADRDVAIVYQLEGQATALCLDELS